VTYGREESGISTASNKTTSTGVKREVKY